MRPKFLLLAAFALAALAGCVNTRKITYFNDIAATTGSDSVNLLSPLKIQPGDILQITVTTLDKDVSAMLNPITVAASPLPGNNPEPGYLVDSDGNIDLPLAGKLHVQGKTTKEVNAMVTSALEKNIRNAYVSTRLVNFRIAVLGDVAHPGSYKIPTERASILDALSLAGDMNVTARRNDVMLIREHNGVKTYTSLNLNDSKILSSPYYYLNNNDVVYVKPGPNKVFGTSKMFQLLPAIIGVLSLATTLIIVTK